MLSLLLPAALWAISCAAQDSSAATPTVSLFLPWSDTGNLAASVITAVSHLFFKARRTRESPPI